MQDYEGPVTVHRLGEGAYLIRPATAEESAGQTCHTPEDCETQCADECTGAGADDDDDE